MDNNTFMGYLVVSIITLVGFYIALRKEIIASERKRSEPLQELNNNIAELNGTIKMLNSDTRSLKDRVSEHGKQIDNLRMQNERHEIRIENIEKAQSKLG